MFSLRIFFERANKTTNVVSWLGNVYRNSKWSSLSFQNIKSTFRVQMFIVYLFLFSIFSIFYFWFHNISILKYFTFTPSSFWYILQDSLSYFSLLILSCIYIFIQKLDFLFSTFVPNFLLSVGSTNQEKKLNNIVLKKLDQPTLKHKNIFQYEDNKDPGVLILALNLQKVLYFLALVNINYPKKHFTHYNDLFFLDKVNIGLVNSNHWLKLYFTNFKYYNFIPISNTKISCLENSYKIFPSKTDNIFYSNLNLNIFFGLGSTLHNISLGSLSKNLNLGKQNRWLLKSSILSDKLNIDINKITHTKKLFNNLGLDLLSSNSNLWASNKLAINSNFLKLNKSLPSFIEKDFFLKSYVNLSSSSSSLAGYETSLVWVVKRFSFTQKMHYNIQKLSSIMPITRVNSVLFLKGFDFSKLYQLSLYYNYKYIISNFSFYKNTMYYSLPNYTKSSNLINYSFPNSQGLFNKEDINFVKFIYSSLFLQKNKVLFFSFL